MSVDSEGVLSQKCLALRKRKEGRQPGRRIRSRFIRGPLDLKWLRRASCISRTACVVGLVAWYRRGLEGKNQVPIYRSDLKSFCVGHTAAADALLSLEQAGLIAVDRKPGKCPRVTIILPEGD